MNNEESWIPWREILYLHRLTHTAQHSDVTCLTSMEVWYQLACVACMDMDLYEAECFS